MKTETDDEITEELLAEEDGPDIKEIISDIVPKKKRKNAKAPEEYINKDLMWAAFKDYYDAVEKDGDIMIPLNLALMIDDIVTHMQQRPNFSNYSWLEEMAGDAKVKMFKAVNDRSFKLYKTAEIVDTIDKKGDIVVYFMSKKAKKDFIDNKKLEPEDVISEKNGKKYITFKSNPFGFYSRIVWHCFINRIKKEKQVNETKIAYQEEIYERMYASEAWKNVRRQKVSSDDGDDDTLEFTE